MQSYELPSLLAINTLKLLRERKPLIHCLTNDVVQNITANILLAIGAHPAMVIEPEEAAQFSTIADALLINIGTLCQTKADAMIMAITNANIAGKPWVLDPVGIGILHYRTKFANLLISLQPSVVRGNASEILALAGEHTSIKGVDSGNASSEALSAAICLSTTYHTIVVVTGEQDLITNGKHIWKINDGHLLMTRITGIGCSLSAIVAACCTLSGNKLDHIAGACYLMACAGRLTASWAKSPGIFSIGIIDKLYTLCAKDLI